MVFGLRDIVRGCRSDLAGKLLKAVKSVQMEWAGLTLIFRHSPATQRGKVRMGGEETDYEQLDNWNLKQQNSKIISLS